MSSLLKKSKKENKSFLDSPALEILNKAIEEVEKQAVELPFLLEGQESNLFLNQAAEIAIIEMRLASQFANQLIALHRKKLNILEAKVKIIEQMETMSSVETTCNQAKGFKEKMNDLSEKIKKGYLDFLKSNVIRRPENAAVAATQSNIKQETFEESISMQSLTAPLQDISHNTQEATALINVAFIDKSIPPQKPQFSSDFGRKLVADTEESARKTRRMYTPSRVESVARSLFIPPTIEEKENTLAKILQSGGSSLDGSFIRPGGTYDDVFRPPSATPGKAPPSMINFDETGLEEFDNIKEFIPQAPPMNLPQNNKADLGPINNQTPLKLLPEIPTRPTFSSAFAQRLNKM